MSAELLAPFVAVEQRGEDLERQGPGDELRRLPERIEHDAARLGGFFAVLLQLPVALGEARLVAGGFVAVNPWAGVDDLAHAADAVGVQDAFYLHHHRAYGLR